MGWLLECVGNMLFDMPCAVTCDTSAPSYRSCAVSAPGAVAARAERRQETKYSHLARFCLWLLKLWVLLVPKRMVS